jgi:hypothetical protein
VEDVYDFVSGIVATGHEHGVEREVALEIVGAGVEVVLEAGFGFGFGL